MEVKLESLIEKIKTEGIEQARQNAQAIIDKAQEEARQIINQAQTEANQVLENARLEARKIEANTLAALKQAERDTILVTREKLKNLFDTVLKKEIGATLTPGFLARLILVVVQSIGSGAEVLLNETDLTELQALLLDKTHAGLSEAVAFKIDKGISKGFRIGRQGDHVYYDFTDQSLTDFLREFLNPSITELLNRDNG